MSGKVPAQDGLLARASKKLVSEEGLLPELGPTRLDRDLQKYIWNGKPHLSLKDLWEYLNRYTYLPRLKDKQVLIKAVQAAVSSMLPGPFAYAERWDEASGNYRGLVIDKAANSLVVIDSDCVIVNPDIAEQHRPEPNQSTSTPTQPDNGTTQPNQPNGKPAVSSPNGTTTSGEPMPTRFVGTVMISPDRPAREIHKIIEAVVEQLTTLPDCAVSIKLEIDAEKADGFDRSKVRTVSENANTLDFIDKDFR